MGAVLMGAAVVCAPMDTQASGALGSSGQIGISADLEAVEDTSVLEVAMNDIVISEFNLEGYSNLGIVTVSEGKVNIRETPSTDGKIVGKIGKDAGCDVLGEEGDWLHIKSGEVEGYIKAEYVLTGTDALQQASTLLKKVAKVTTDGLKVRTEPNTECEILDMVGSGQSGHLREGLPAAAHAHIGGSGPLLSPCHLYELLRTDLLQTEAGGLGDEAVYLRIVHADVALLRLPIGVQLLLDALLPQALVFGHGLGCVPSGFPAACDDAAGVHAGHEGVVDPAPGEGVDDAGRITD